MKLSIKALKDAFLTECNRASNMELGISNFQEFEITHFLNTAYMLCVNKRLGMFDERYAPLDKRINMQDPKQSAFPASMRILQDFGELYISTGLLEPESLFDKSHDLGACGAATRFFRIPRAYPIIDPVSRKVIDTKQLRETPYLVNVSIHEYLETKTKPTTIDSLVGNVGDTYYTRTHTQLCRPINPVDVTRMALLYQDDKYMPYVYYRVRPIKYYLETEFEDAQKKKSVDRSYYIDDFIEVSYQIRNGGNEIKLQADMVCYPRPLTTAQVLEESENEYIEVMFGYEIAQTAAAIAMESLGSSRAQSLTKIAQESEPQ